MATNRRFMPVPPEAVWDALADPGGYGYWVVGSKEIRDADPRLAGSGSRFHHTSGSAPLRSMITRRLLEARAPDFLRLRAKARPFGTARVTMQMTPKDGGTVVRDDRDTRRAHAVLSLNPLVHVLTKLRNAESLMRLEELALRRARYERVRNPRRIVLDRCRRLPCPSSPISARTSTPTSL